ncbi:MAG: phytase [Porticoccaceae bacterium]|nr:phytase [Porticoccaceae bacterium]
MHLPFRLISLTALTSLLIACGGDEPALPADSDTQAAVSAAVASQPPANPAPQILPTLEHWVPAGAQRAEFWHLLPATGASGGDRLAADAQGLWLLDASGTVVAHHEGNFMTLDVRHRASELLIATTQTASQQPTLLAVEADTLAVQHQLVLDASAYRIENLCLYEDESRNLHLFVVGEEGLGDQWLVATGEALLDAALHVRSLRLPPESEYCTVDDRRHLLYVSEENVGIWAYGAHPEAEQSRQPVDLIAPFGGLQEMVAGLASGPGGLLALDADARQLHRYSWQQNGWQHLPPLALAGTVEPERLTLRVHDGEAELLLVDGDDGKLYRTAIDWPASEGPRADALPVLLPTVQTEPVPSAGDAADDPAIWVHPYNRAASRVLGTDKRNGLGVYDLDGNQLQYLRVGRLNNVDVRHGFLLGERKVDLAVASNRDNNSLHLFAIDPGHGELSDLGQILTPLQEIYGLCMGQAPDGTLYAIANDKDGRFLQYRLDGSSGKARGELAREFAVATQPEGCVVDDQRQRLFIGEEGTAVWALAAAAEAPVEMTQVIAVGGPVAADIEGLAIYQHPEHPYLVISSQGNDSYVIVDAEPPYSLRGSFRIGINSSLAIDGVSETDGLEVTSADLGGPWSQGLLVVQDGRKRLPEGNQNYKYVPWQRVADALNLD